MNISTQFSIYFEKDYWSFCKLIHTIFVGVCDFIHFLVWDTAKYFNQSINIGPNTVHCMMKFLNVITNFRSYHSGNDIFETVRYIMFKYFDQVLKLYFKIPYIVIMTHMNMLQHWNFFSTYLATCGFESICDDFSLLIGVICKNIDNFFGFKASYGS